MTVLSKSKLLYVWRFTANQFVLVPSPLRFTTRDLFFSTGDGHQQFNEPTGVTDSECSVEEQLCDGRQPNYVSTEAEDIVGISYQATTSEKRRRLSAGSVN
jgi:hypothetical protein